MRYLSVVLDVIGVILAGVGLIALAWLLHPYLSVFVCGVVCVTMAFVLEHLPRRGDA